MTSPRLRVLFCFALLITAIIPVILNAQSPTPSMGLRFVPPNHAYQIGEGLKTTRLAAGALVVSYVAPGSPAALAGIRPGDVVTAFNGKRVCQGDDFSLSTSSIGSEATLGFVRGDEIRSVKLKIANRGEFEPEFVQASAAIPNIAAALQRSDFKAVISECRAMPESKQALNHTGCAVAHYLRRDWRGGMKLFQLGQSLCPQCPEMYSDQASALKTVQDNYADIWAKTVQLMNEFSAGQNQAFAAMDSRIAADLKKLSEQGQAQKALDQYGVLALDEVGCRSVPPSSELVSTVVELKAKLDPTLSISEDVARMAKQARTAAQVAKTPEEMNRAEQKWVGVIWLAPWWKEGYTNAADLLDGLGFPDHALAIGKRALELPWPKTASQPVAVLVEEPITDPADAIRKCVNGLSTAEKGSAEEQRFRLRAISAALKMSPVPEIPLEARRLVARGQAAIEMAQNKADFDDAASEFEKSINIAPWWGDAYRGLGMACEKGSNYRQAMAAYELYMKAAPNAPDVTEVQNKIFKLEYAADREDKQAFERVIAQKTASARQQALQGLWREKVRTTHVWQVTLQNGMFVASKPGYTEDGTRYNGPFTIKASIKGNALDGTVSGPAIDIVDTGCSVSASEQPLTGTISDDGRTMMIKYQQTKYSTQYIKATLFTVARCTKIEKLRDDLITVVMEKQ